MSLLLPLLEMLKDPLMKGLTQARNDLSEYINDINDAISLIQSPDSNTQREGLEQLHAELTHLKESEAWQLLQKSKLKQLVYINRQLDALLELLHLAIDEFEQDKGRERNLTLISQKAGRLVLKLPKTGQRNFYSKMLIRLLLLVAPAGGIYLITDYISDRNRLKKDRSELISLAKEYEYKSMENSYLIEAESKNTYYERFNNLYFDEKTQEVEKAKLLGDDKLLLKVMMKNSSGHVPLMLSSLQLEVAYQAEPFDWAPLATETALNLELGERLLKLIHTSKAPALNAHLVTNAGLDTFFNLVESTKFCEIFGQKEYLKLNSEGKLKDHERLYYWVGDTWKLPEQGYVNNQWGCFKVIEHVDDFAELISGQQIARLKVELTYEDLKEQSTELQETYELETAYFVFDKDTLLSESPVRERFRIEYPDQIINPEYSMDIAENALKLLGQTPIIDPNGVQLYRDSLKMNLANLSDGAQKTVYRNIDQVLNPDGYVVLYVSLHNPANGNYVLKVKSNGLEVDEFSIESMVAPENTFAYPGSLKYFRAMETDSIE